MEQIRFSPGSSDLMSQTCRVCGEPAAGFHFGAFTCEGCKSFFGRTYSNQSSLSECKNNGECVINKKNRTSCKACRLRKCLMVGMSKSGSRYGRRSNWFKIHCVLQQQKMLEVEANNNSLVSLSPSAGTMTGTPPCWVPPPVYFPAFFLPPPPFRPPPPPPQPAVQPPLAHQISYRPPPPVVEEAPIDLSKTSCFQVPNSDTEHEKKTPLDLTCIK